MNSPLTKPTLSRAGLRNFGLLTGGIFAVLFGLLFPWLGGSSTPVWPWVLMVAFWIPALLLPQVLQSVYAVWMKVGHVLGWINTRILLGVIYYLFIVPLGLLMRVVKQGRIREMAAASGETLRQPSHPRSGNHFERLF